MSEATIAQTIMTLLILLIFLGFLIWGIKSGQFHNVEDAKYHIFDKDTDNTKRNIRDKEERQ
jgi:cbb3-type cytochrome oxidase maturation protein